MHAVDELADRARAGDGRAFRELTEPYRGELQLHCYRLLGSIHDAEDLVQETLLAAWRGIGSYRGEASVRAWLYRIATNRCFNAVRDAGRRPRTVSAADSESAWAEPYPGLPEPVAPEPGPEARYEAKESVALAFVTALQRLPVPQRAALVLRDALGFPAAEVARRTGSTPAAVNSALQRARAAMPAPGAAGPSRAADPELVNRFATAFAESDIDALVALLTPDARLSMPPEPMLVTGPAEIAALFGRIWVGRPPVRLIPTTANGQPAFGYYHRVPHTPWLRANGLIVLTVSGDRIGAITRFHDNSLLPAFGLPRTLPVA
ncbi:RNA polymerase subunit sigma-70 [Nocardia sp. JMUB6875]|uniref:RNA polymerase subunit sigma-70 n=1 Tax=Nocardia sp. JMUB6875 TaxID=3158170 RepID=UPI0032E6501B